MYTISQNCLFWILTVWKQLFWTILSESSTKKWTMGEKIGVPNFVEVIVVS